MEIEGRLVHVRAWRYDVVGARGHVVPVYLLDTDLAENSDVDRRLTDSLYGGDNHYRLAQEVVLGMGGAGLLRALGFTNGVQHHVNEGHAALVALALLERRLGGRSALGAGGRRHRGGAREVRLHHAHARARRSRPLRSRRWRSACSGPRA